MNIQILKKFFFLFYKRWSIWRLFDLPSAPFSHHDRICWSWFSVRLLGNLHILIQWPRFSADKRLRRGVEIKFMSENALSTSAVDGGTSAAVSMIFVISWCFDMSLLSVHQSFSIISKLKFCFWLSLSFSSETILCFFFAILVFLRTLCNNSILVLRQLFFYLSQPRMNFDLIHIIIFLRQQLFKKFQIESLNWWHLQ